MTGFIQINDGELVPLETVKRVSDITSKEVDELRGLHPNVDASRFHSKIEFADGKKRYVPESVSEIRAQGVAFIQTAGGQYVPKDHIRSVKNLRPQDRQQFEAGTGRALREEYQSKVETKAGMVLSTTDAATFMKQMQAPQSQRSPVTMAQQRDAVLAKAGPQKTEADAAPTHQPTQ